MARKYSGVPPGFRFHPTDEELVNYYLKKKVALDKFDLDVIRDVDLNKLEPWDLHEKCRVDSTQETDWYFFSHKDRKYPSGTRTNRATVAGFWKATGRDKSVLSSLKCIGMRKTLVFYLGRAPHGQKTDWIMHEYRLEDNADNANTGNEEGWVVCRVFKKRYPQPKAAQLIKSSELDKNPLNHVIMPKLERNSNDHGLFMPHERLITCKQETDQYGNINEIRDAQYNNPLMHEVSCLHLPQLESPDQNNVLENNPNNLNTSFELGTKARGHALKNPDECFGSSTDIIFPSEFPTTNNNLSNESNKFWLVSEELLTEYCNTGGSHLGTDWGLLEGLSKDINTRNEIDQYHENHAAFPMFQTISKEQLSELYSFPNNSTDQGEFWSFISTR